MTGILDRIRSKFGGDAFAYGKRKDEAVSSSPFYLYRIETPPITGRGRVILLDALGIKPKLATQRTLLRTFYYDSSTEVTTPTVGAILGDKLSVIGPNTIGRPLRDSRNGLEYAKHLYDISSLSASEPDFEECSDAYCESLQIQSQIRGRDFDLEECLDDAVFTCKVASLPQQLGEQAIENLKPPERDRASSEYKILREGDVFERERGMFEKAIDGLPCPRAAIVSIKENVPFRIFRMLNSKVAKPLSGDYYFLDDYNIVLCVAGGDIYEHGTPKPIVAEVIPVRGDINIKAVAEDVIKLAFLNWGSPGRSYSVPAPVRMAHELASELSSGVRRAGPPF